MISIKIDWDSYFMSLCFLVSQRSIDSTKHGCIIVDDDHTVLSMGYNGPPRGCIDQEIPLTRPLKYGIMKHSEDAAIINAAKHGTNINRATYYITGKPCSRCLGSIINAGGKKIIYGGIKSHCVDENDEEISKMILKGQDIKIVEYNGKHHKINLLNALEYSIIRG